MFLRYLYAALSAFIPLWSIFNHPKLVQWTKTLSSYVVPRLFLPPPDHLSTIGPLVPNIPKVAEDVNTSLALLDGLSLSIANKSSENHPLSDTVHILWGALVQVPQSPSVQLYTVLLVALGLIYLGLSVTRRFLLPNPTLCSKGEVLQTDHLVPLAKALALVGDLGHSDSVHHEDTRSDHSRRPSQDPGAYNRPLPAVLISAMDTLQVSEPVVPDSPLDPVVAPAEHYSLEVQHSLPCLTVTPRAVTSSTEAPIGRPSPEVSTVSVSSPIATPAGHLPEDQRAPQCVVDNQEIKVSAQPPFPPSPDMEDAVSVADSTPYVSFPPSPCVPSEAALVSMDCSIESEEPTLGEVDAIKLETLMKSQDTAPDISSLDPGDGGRKPNLDFVPVKAIVASDPGKDVEEPSLLESSQGSF